MFSMDKVLHEIIYLLSLETNKTMNLLKLMKELYLVDRESIAERDISVSGDVFYSMPHGPVLSATLNMLNDLNNNNWGQFLTTTPGNYYPDIKLIQNTDPIHLSLNDKKYINTIFNKFKNHSPKQIEEYTHKLPEWEDPKGSSIKIHFRDIMLALNKTEEDIVEAKQDYNMLNNLAQFRN